MFKGLVLAAESVFKEFLDTANALWSKYLEVGPGKLDSTDRELLERAVNRVREPEGEHTIPRDGWRAEFDATLAVLEPLLRRCATRSEGLCFVTGEAGLIPNQQQHRKCSDALLQLANLVRELDNN